MKKLSKLLSVFVITGAVSASLGALAACGHTHEWEWKSENGQHWQECKGCEEKTEKENHVDTDNNLICDKCEETLTPATIAVTGITIGGPAAVVAGQTITLTATLAPTGATGTVVWSSLDTSKATVNSSTGEVTGVAAGTVTIKATVGTVSQIKEITVTAAAVPVESVTVSGDAEVAIGSSVTLAAAVLPANATNATVAWSSSDETKATVNPTTGEVTGVAAGQVTITATAGGISGTKVIEVKPIPVESVTVSGDNSVDVGDKITLTAAVLPENATNKTVTWSSSDETKATVNASTGEVTGVAAGQVTITATADGVNGTKVIEVKPKYNVTFNMNGNGTAIAAAKTKGGKVTAPTAPTAAGFIFGGWYEEAECTNFFDFDSVLTADKDLYACWIDATTYESVTSKADIGALADAYPSKVKPTTDVTQGKFTFGAGCYFEKTHSSFATGCVNNQQKKVSFNLTGVKNSNTIKFAARGAGSGVLTFYKSDGTVLKEFGTIDGTKRTIEIKNLPAGEYYIQSVGSLRIGEFEITEILEKAEASGISVTGGTRRFMAGRNFSYEGLAVSLEYSNGRKDLITTATVSGPTADQMKVPGKYTVNVSYTPTGASTPFTTSYDVFVCEIEEIRVSDYSMDSKRNTLPVQKIFRRNDADGFNSANLAVTAKCLVPETVNEHVDFVLKTDEYTLTAPDLTTLGKKTVNISLKSDATKTASYDIAVVDLQGVSSVIVDASENNPGTVSENKIVVNTVNDAVQCYKFLNLSDETEKVILVKEGVYNQKVVIDIPNVKLKGEADKAATTVLVFNALNGMTDPSGTTAHSTDGSASVTIDKKAFGFYAENVEFRNYYNTNALYEESKFIGSGTQAVALLVRGDKAVFKNCRISGYHDTLYADEGRQLYENCYIEGRTDYIFGSSATAYFKNCEIVTLGAGVTEKNGGYIVATKGAAGLKYGYIFDSCDIKGDANVRDGSVSIARGWETNMTLAVINCSISKAYSKQYFGEGKTTEAELNDRYTNMNANPVAKQLYEYGNTGDGALTYDAGFSGMFQKDGHDVVTILTDAQATEFTTLAKVFAGKNGTANLYADDWDGSSEIKITTKNYDFSVEAKGSTTPFNDVYPDITVTGGTPKWNGNSIQVTVGTKLTFPKQGEITVTWYGGDYGVAGDGEITYSGGIATLEIVGGVSSTIYIKSISINYKSIPADTPTA